MWEPVGPLPASVYWRRRLVAVVSTVAALVLCGWSAAALLAPAGEAGDAASTRAASRAAVVEPQPAVPSPVVPDPSGATPGATPAAPSGTTTGPATATSSEQLRPDDTLRPSVSAAPAVPTPPTGPVECTNAMLGVEAEIDRVQHRVGERPVLRLVVTNISNQPCIRDLDSARQEIVVWSGDGATRLWSSNDCVNASSTDLRTLVPGQPVAFAVTWAGRTSAPGCAQRRDVVPAGAYRVLTRVDDVISPPAPFLRMA